MTAAQSTRLGLRSTINLKTSPTHAYKKTSPHASLKTFADDLKLLPVGPRTEQAYYACVRQLSEHYDRSPERITVEEVRQYCIHLKTVKQVARQTSTQFICAFKLFWEKTLKRDWPQELELETTLGGGYSGGRFGPKRSGLLGPLGLQNCHRQSAVAVAVFRASALAVSRFQHR